MKKSLFLLLGLVFSVDASVNTAGKLVTRFGVNGTATLSLTGNIIFYDVTVDSQQRIIVVGRLQGAGALVARFLPTGQLDTSFNRIGYKTFYYNTISDRAYSVALLGSVIYVGCYNGAGGTFGFVASLNDDGSFNQSWGTQGIYHFTTPTMRFLFHIQAQQDGKILVCGAQTASLGHLARINAAGNALDATFNASGTPGYQVITGYAAYSFIVGYNDVIYVVVNNIINTYVYAFTQSGVVDTAYNGTGVSQELTDCALEYMSQQSNGSFVLEGIDGSNNVIAKRITSAGLVDTSFGDAGAIIPVAGIASNIMVTINDNFFLLYYSDIDFFYYITAYDKNGVLMTTFGDAGTVRLDNEASSLASTSNGTLIIVGAGGADGLIQEFTEYDPGQVGFTDTSLSLVPNMLGESTVAVTPVYRVSVTNQQLLPDYVRAGLTGF